MATFPGANGATAGLDPNLLAALMGGGAGAPTGAPTFTPPVPTFTPSPVQSFGPSPQGFGLPTGLPQFGCGEKLNKLA